MFAKTPQSKDLTLVIPFIKIKVCNAELLFG